MRTAMMIYAYLIQPGAWVPDTTPAPEIMFQYAQGAQKDPTATNKKFSLVTYPTQRDMLDQ